MPSSFKVNMPENLIDNVPVNDTPSFAFCVWWSIEFKQFIWLVYVIKGSNIKVMVEKLSLMDKESHVQNFNFLDILMNLTCWNLLDFV